jgi:putative methyltransferase (TIGR04325 family)
MGISETIHGGIDRVLDTGPLRWLRMRRYERYFAEGKPFLAHRGVYQTLAEARQSIPAASARGYDDTAAANLHLDRTELVYPSDYPAMLWLNRLFRDGCTTVFDVGGNVGVSYYSFGRFMELPPSLRWLVCEVPSTVQQGRRLAAERDRRKQLGFTEAVEDAEGFDVLMACGVTQYLPTPLSDSLGSSPRSRAT